MSRFSNAVETQEKMSEWVKNISNGNEFSENINVIEIAYVAVRDHLNIDRAKSNEKAFVSEIPNIINEENGIVSPRQKENQFQFKVINL